MVLEYGRRNAVDVGRSWVMLKLLDERTRRYMIMWLMTRENCIDS